MSAQESLSILDAVFIAATIRGAEEEITAHVVMMMEVAQLLPKLNATETIEGMAQIARARTQRIARPLQPEHVAQMEFVQSRRKQIVQVIISGTAQPASA